MNCWLLKIRICGEWEECRFLSKAEALAAFIALASDYNTKLERAVLVAPQASEANPFMELPQSNPPQLIN